MISAELHYRNHVPHGYYAIECSDIDFHGNMELTNLLNNVVYEIVFEKCRKLKPLIERLEAQRSALREEYNAWKQELDKLKKKHPLWKLKRELREEVSVLTDECNKLASEHNVINSKIKTLEGDKFYTAFEKTWRYKQMLTHLGFSCKSTTRSASNLQKAVYESTCSDEELMKKAQAMLDKLKEQEKQSKIDSSVDVEDILE